MRNEIALYAHSLNRINSAYETVSGLPNYEDFYGHQVSRVS